MEHKLNSYFCYLNQGDPVVVEKEPENFRQLPYNYTMHCPTPEIAQMAYRTNLKIMEWRLKKAR
ncbi:hypothetical protein KKI24_12340 [bacterium]|nr:hypothetical protein [bacterium]